MSARTTVLLLGLVLLVGGHLWWEHTFASSTAGPAASARGAPGAAPTQALRRFFELDPGQVVRIRLHREGSTREAQRSDTGWPTPAIAEFLRTLTQVGVLMDISGDSGAAAEYGLQPPRSEAQLYLAGVAAPLVLRIGDRNPPSTSVYVQVGTDGPIGLAGALVDWEFEKAFRGLGPPTPAAAD